MFTVSNFGGFGPSRRAINAPNTAGLMAWYDFADISKMTTSGTLITTATDKGTNTYNLSNSKQGHAGTDVGPLEKFPALGSMTNAVTAEVLPCADFRYSTAGTSTLWRPALYNQLSTATSPTSVSILVVARNMGTATESSYQGCAVGLCRQDMRIFGGGGFEHQCLNDTNTDTFRRVGWGGISAGTNTGATIGTYTRPDDWHLMSMTRDAGGTGCYYLDGGAGTASQTNLSSSSFTNISVGANTGTATNMQGDNQNTWCGLVGEVRIFGTNLGTTDRQIEEGYLAWKWGLQGNLPAGHPYKNSPP